MPPTRDLDAAVLLQRVIEAAIPYEFRTFVIGFERPDGYERTSHEDAFRALKIELGRGMERRFPGARAEFVTPEIEIRIGKRLEVGVRSAPIFIAGRYRKLSREIPSSRWIHHECGGRGCPTCGLTGTLCGPSVEELLDAPVLEHSGAEKAYLHALGREDTDARMLGRGRPFVLEVHRPVRRTLPLDEIRERFHASAGGIAEVRDLAHADRSMVAILKEAAAEKSYRAWIETPSPVPPNAAEIAASLEGAVVEQLSPTRVAGRRGAGTLRRRRILESTWLGETGSGVAWEIRVEAGMYVKELVSGDGGRTAPSLRSALGMECACAALDVLDVHWSFPWESADRHDKALS